LLTLSGAPSRREVKQTTHERLQDLLAKNGFRVEGDLWQRAEANTSATSDLAIWGGKATYRDRPCDFYSWDTMVHFAQEGIDWVAHEDEVDCSRTQIEIRRRGNQ